MSNTGLNGTIRWRGSNIMNKRKGVALSTPFVLTKVYKKSIFTPKNTLYK